VGNTLWNDIRKKVTKSIQTGNRTETLKREIEKIGKFSEYRADTIARTETGGAYINGNYAGEQALGQFGPVEKVWVASLDDRTRQSHVAVWQSSLRNPVPFAQPFNVGNTTMMYPHSPGAPAKEVVNCRCYYDSYYVGDRRPNGTIITAPQQNAKPQESLDYQGARLRPRDFDGKYQDIINTGGGFDGDLSPRGDLHLLQLWKRQGFDATPARVSGQQLDELITDRGWTRLHRGIAGETVEQVDDYVSQFVTGAEPFAGKGMFGNGTYASKSVETAEQFTKQTARGEATNVGIRLDMALHPEAKIVDYEGLFPLMRQIVDEERVARNALYDAVAGSDDLSWSEVIARAPEGLVEKYRDAEAKRYLLAERPGNLATVEGYDAIRIVNPHVNVMTDESVDDIYYVILNRGALAVKET
jgi:hypothetical protein